MRYKVPQFVDMEDKIIGPVTMRQLLILGVGGGIAYAAYARAGSLWPFISIPAAILAIAFAFVKVQDMSFFQYLLAAIQYFVRPEKRTWVQHADYIQPPKDLLEKQKEEKKDHPEDDKKLLKNVGQYAAVLDGDEKDLMFEAFHDEGKHKDVEQRLKNAKASDTKSVQERVARAKKVNAVKSAPIKQNNHAF